MIIKKSKFLSFTIFKSKTDSKTLFDMLESVYLNLSKRGLVNHLSKEFQLYTELVENVFNFTEKGTTSTEFLKSFKSSCEDFDESEIPKPKIVKGMPASFKKRLQEEYE